MSKQAYKDRPLLVKVVDHIICFPIMVACASIALYRVQKEYKQKQVKQ